MGQTKDPGGKAGEYLEKLVADGFKRELDQEENVVRSLPFFATSIGVLVALLGLARPELPPISGSLDVTAGALYLFLLLIVICLALLILFLFQAVRRRRFEEPSNEGDLAAYAKELTSFYARSAIDGKPPDPAAVEQAVVDDLRATMIEQLGRALLRLPGATMCFA